VKKLPPDVRPRDREVKLGRKIRTSRSSELKSDALSCGSRQK